MQIFLIVYAAFSAVILSVHLALAVGLVRNMLLDRRARQKGARSPGGLRAEVVVALRNEEKTLPALLRSLSAQTATSATFLFVDDRSTDATGALLDEFCRVNGGRARVIHNSSEPDGLTGKQAALDLAFGACSGDVLLFTDGDCEVPPQWVEEMLIPFEDPSVGVVIGRIELQAAAGNFLQLFQAFEQPLLNQYNLGSVGIGLATGCFGNNMAVRTVAVKAAGAFRTLGYSVTEDAMLLDAVRRAGWKARARASFPAAARTRGKARWGDYVNQHTRWNAGGLFSEDPVTRLSYIVVVLIYLTSNVVLLPLGFLDWRIAALSTTSFAGIAILAAVGALYERNDRLSYLARLLPFVVFFGFFYVFVTLRALAMKPFEWKGRVLTPRSAQTPGQARGTPGA
ncbi:MAG TPA: glycosyltransferase [Spirochaetia bacterium]|nr:glycosyltransferase [Spirochaetia bacterium]